jgi:hypothetical protein
MKYIFFGYESGHTENKDSINKAIREFNGHQKSYEVVSWENLGIGGRIINKAIIDKINSSDFFACELSYINHNVLFELGYAVGRRKKLLLFLNSSIAGAHENYSSIKFLRNIGYVNYSTYKEILNEINSKANAQVYMLDEITKLDALSSNVLDLFYMSPRLESQASLDLQEYLDKSQYKKIINDTTEVEYQTLVWYVNTIYKSKNVVIHLVNPEKSQANLLNGEASFYAGVALGLEKNVLLLAPKPFKAPIDYEDILIEYDSSEECVIKCDDWVSERKIKESESNSYLKSDKMPDNEETLLRLGIGNEVAESEKKELLENYFIPFEGYNKAKEKRTAIIVGRKGSGKSALFIKLENELLNEKNNFTVVLKPEADEIIENIELSYIFNSERSKRAFFNSTWKFIFYNKLLESIYNYLLPKIDNSNYVLTSEEELIISTIKNSEQIFGLNFYGVMKKINEQVNKSAYINNPSILEEVFDKYISKSIFAVSNFLKNSKYIKLNIIADNLDATWENRENLNLHADMILSLLDFCVKIQEEIQHKTKNDSLTVNLILFLRKDIFEYILSKSKEPDKLVGIHYELDWSRQQNLLKRIIEERFRYKLNLASDFNIQEIWTKYFKLSNRNNPFETILNYVIPRPRDVIYFITRLFEGAIDNSHNVVEKDDLDYAVEHYSKFLHNNMIAEMKASFPEIDVILMELQKKFTAWIDYPNFISTLKKKKYDEKRQKEFIKSLFEKQYIVGINKSNKNKKILTIEELENSLEEKRFFFMKSRVVILLNPQVIYLKSLFNKW